MTDESKQRPPGDEGAAGSGDDAELRIQGPIRRNLPLILAVLAVLVAGPFISRLLASYRAVVLDVRDDEMLVAYAELAPEWVDRVEVEPGRVVAKRRWSWSLEPVPAGPEDAKALALYERYASRWSGRVVEVVPAPPGQPFDTVVVETDAGERLKLSTETQTLTGAKVGQRVVKEPGAWDPVLAD